MLYFLAGLKKTDMEWLEGYSMSNLGIHWVFDRSGGRQGLPLGIKLDN